MNEPGDHSIWETPEPVYAYLCNNGWAIAADTPRTLWVRPETMRRYTWEQALAYEMFRKLHLGLK